MANISDFHLADNLPKRFTFFMYQFCKKHHSNYNQKGWGTLSFLWLYKPVGLLQKHGLLQGSQPRVWSFDWLPNLCLLGGFQRMAHASMMQEIFPILSLLHTVSAALYISGVSVNGKIIECFYIECLSVHLYFLHLFWSPGHTCGIIDNDGNVNYSLDRI